MYYDQKGRLVQRHSSNVRGGYDKEYYAYSFTGKPLRHHYYHDGGNRGTTSNREYVYSYDDAERLTEVRCSLNGATQMVLYSNSYDGYGRLQKRSYNANGYSTSYAYNIRNWPTGISGSKFTQNLYYHTGNGTPCYGGNVSSMTWKSGNESTLRGYKFSYDGVNCLLTASYGEGSSLSANANRFTEQITGYDKNSNIIGLKRYGQTDTGTYGLFDNLTVTLSGNQLKAVNDVAASPAYNNGFEFRNGIASTQEYNYDKNGNLTQDLNKDISKIEYNLLNLPLKVTFKDGSTISYIYGGNGAKLKTIHKIGAVTTATEYCSDVIYENGVAKLLLTEAGYITLSDKKYHYYLQDHQGNNRVVIDQNGNVKETNHYYRFGGVFASSGNVQLYKHNGKEFDAKKGLNWYDYEARQYDPVLGRFTTIDPLTEKYYSINPFTYCLNNPIKFIDPTGQFVSPIYDRNGRLLGTDDEGLKGNAIIMNKSNFKQGMSHEEALSYSLGYEGLIDDQARSNYTTSYTGLKDRPDYDGYLTKSEADAWWRGKSGEPLFVDQSKIELHGINTSSFKKKNPISKNFIWRLTNTGKVYGTLKMTLVDAEKGKVFIGLKSYMDKYDFNMDGRFFRDFAT